MLLFLLLCSAINAYKCCTCDIFLSVLGWYHHDIRGALSVLRLLKLKGKFLYLKNSVEGGRKYAKDFYILFLIGNHDNITFQWLLLGTCCNILLSGQFLMYLKKHVLGGIHYEMGLTIIILNNDVTFHQSLHGTHCNHGNSYFSALIRLEVRKMITGMRAVDLYFLVSWSWTRTWQIYLLLLLLEGRIMQLSQLYHTGLILGIPVSLWLEIYIFWYQGGIVKLDQDLKIVCLQTSGLNFYGNCCNNILVLFHHSPQLKQLLLEPFMSGTQSMTIVPGLTT